MKRHTNSVFLSAAKMYQFRFEPIFPLLVLIFAAAFFQIAVVTPATTTGSRGTNSSTNCTKTPTLNSTQTWVLNPNCTNGTTYNTNNGTTHCHCWSHCGYICGPRNTTTNSTTSTTTTTTTAAPTTTTTASVTTTTTAATTNSTTAASTCTRQPALTTGQTFVNNAGCTNGTTYDTSASIHCHCWSFCGYICGPKPFSTTTAATTTTTTASSG